MKTGEDRGFLSALHEVPSELPLTVRKSARARRLRLEVHPGSLVLIIPRRCPEDRVEAFLRSQAGWIHTQTEAWRLLAGPAEGPLSAPIPDQSTPGWILFRGQRVLLASALTDQPRCQLTHAPDHGVRVAIPEAWTPETRALRARKALDRWFDGILVQEAQALVASHGEPHGLIPTRIGFGAPRTRWGSCSSRGTLRLNRRLIGAPPEVYRYVVLHELAHLRFPHHRPPFWKLVALLDPDWRTHANWLKRFGVALG